jgi:hypothetical protein
MIRNIKALGLTALAAMAMAAVFASAAHATPNGVFKAGATPNTHTATVITASQEGLASQNFFETDSGVTNCTNTGVTFSGSDADGTATELAATPTYHECLAAGTNPMTVDMNGCSYNFDQPTHVAEHKTWTGNVDVVCPGSNRIEITAFVFGGTGHDGDSFLACNTTVLPANNLGHVVYHNKPAGGVTPKDYLTLDVTVSGITYEEHGFGCANDTELTHNGVYKSTVIVKADNPNTPAADDHDLWISTHG